MRNQRTAKHIQIDKTQERYGELILVFLIRRVL